MSWMNRIAALVRPKKLDAALEEELQFHIESRTRHHVAEGMTPQEARRQARLGFGA